jgi:ribosomal protein S18 acetylase RimI-like enzyme
VVIEPLRLEHAAALAKLARDGYAAAFGQSFSPSDLAAHLEANLSDAGFRRALEQDIILEAMAGGRLIGFVQFGDLNMAEIKPSEGDQEIRRLYVDAEFQGRGLGRRLMLAALDHPRLRNAKNIYLDVWEENHAARRFYERHGFEVIGSRKPVLASGEEADDDLIMVRRAKA